MPEDLEQIQNQVFSPLGGRLVDAEKVDGCDVLRDIEKLALPLDKMGHETLSLLLLPPEDVRAIVYQGAFVDTSASNVIEVGRCYIEDGLIAPARFWYEARRFTRAGFIEKDARFVSWAEQIFRRTKKVLSMERYSSGGPMLKEWFGPSAWKQVAQNRLRARLN